MWPTDALLGRPGEQGRYVRCPNPDVWNVFWGSMLVIDPLYMVGGKWRVPFRGELALFLQPEERLPFMGERSRAVWISGDATLTWSAVVSWGDKKDPRVSTDAIRTLIGKDDYQLIAGECELAIAVLTLLLWGLKNGSPRIIILCTNIINVSQWFESAKPHGG